MSTTNSNLIKITINSIEQLKTIIKNKTYNSFKLESPIVIMGIQTKTRTRKPGVRPPRTSLRDVVMDTRNLLIQFMNKQEEFNKRQDERWERQEQFNKRQEEFNKQQLKFNKRQEQFNQMVLDVFKHNNLR